MVIGFRWISACRIYIGGLSAFSIQSGVGRVDTDIVVQLIFDTRITGLRGVEQSLEK